MPWSAVASDGLVMRLGLSRTIHVLTDDPIGEGGPQHQALLQEIHLGDLVRAADDVPETFCLGARPACVSAAVGQEVVRPVREHEVEVVKGRRLPRFDRLDEVLDGLQRMSRLPAQAARRRIAGRLHRGFGIKQSAPERLGRGCGFRVGRDDRSKRLPGRRQELANAPEVPVEPPADCRRGRRRKGSTGRVE